MNIVTQSLFLVISGTFAIKYRVYIEKKKQYVPLLRVIKKVDHAIAGLENGLLN